MKTKITYLIMVISLLSATVLATESLPQAGPIALSIVLDTAWSNDNDMPDYQSLARQVIATLRPGDYLEILIATSSKTQIRVAQFIKSGDAQELRNITTLINKVSCPILSDVDVSKSVDFALNRLTKSDAKNSFAYAAVMVFSDGWLNDNDVIKLQQLSKEFKRRNWSLCVTGTHHANKKLLLAANQGDLNFSLISDANPVLWIGRSNTTGKSVVPQAPTPADPQSDKKKSKTNPTTTIGLEISVSQGEEQPTDVQPVPVDKAQEPATPSKAEEKAGKIDKTIPADAGKKPAIETSPQKDRVPSVTKLKPVKKSKTWAWLLPLIALAAILTAVLLNSFSRARKWKSKITSRLNSTQTREQGILIAKLNGQTYSLGRLNYINTIHIGSGPKNTIRIPDKSINDRHIEIYRKGDGLMLKNIGISAIAVNGIQTKPKAKQKLVIPSVIKFNDNTKLNLELLRPDITSPNTRSNEDAK